jgi:esterase/lipase
MVGFYILLGLFILILSIKHIYIWLDDLRLSKYKTDPITGRYVDAVPQINFVQGSDHGVLLLHGYGDTPAAYYHVLQGLRDHNIPYYVPLISGHGLKSRASMKGVQPQYWVNDALDAYDILKSQYERVSVVGHSNGGCLASIVASHREVEHLVLVAPNLYPPTKDLIFKKLMVDPIGSVLLSTLYPCFMQFRKFVNDSKALRKILVYGAFPTISLKALWTVQDWVNLNTMNYKTIALLNPGKDELVHTSRNIRSLEGLKPHIITYDKSNHGLLQDYDKIKVADDIVNLFKGLIF